jgi:hypothetical protein
MSTVFRLLALWLLLLASNSSAANASIDWPTQTRNET